MVNESLARSQDLLVANVESGSLVPIDHAQFALWTQNDGPSSSTPSGGPFTVRMKSGDQ